MEIPTNIFLSTHSLIMRIKTGSTTYRGKEVPGKKTRLGIGSTATLFKFIRVFYQSKIGWNGFLVRSSLLQPFRDDCPLMGYNNKDLKVTHY